MKKSTIGTCVAGVMAIAMMAGCSNNRDYLRDWVGIPETETYKFAVTSNGAKATLHDVNNWSNAGGAAFRFKTKCCKNTIRGYNTTLYESKPGESEYTDMCNLR